MFSQSAIAFREKITDYFNSMVPEVKFASCLEVLLTFRRLLAYKLKVSCIKANQLLRAYALFSRFDEQENSGESASEPVLSGVNDEAWVRATS